MHYITTAGQAELNGACNRAVTAICTAAPGVNGF